MTPLTKFVRAVGWALWSGPIGFVTVMVFAAPFRQHFAGDSGQSIARAIVLILLLSYPTMLFHLFALSRESWEERKKWLVRLFFGGPLTACYYLSTRTDETHAISRKKAVQSRPGQ